MANEFIVALIVATLLFLIRMVGSNFFYVYYSIKFVLSFRAVKHIFNKIKPEIDFNFDDIKSIENLEKNAGGLENKSKEMQKNIEKMIYYNRKSLENFVYFLISTLIIITLGLTNAIVLNVPTEYYLSLYLLTGLNISLILFGSKWGRKLMHK